MYICDGVLGRHVDDYLGAGENVGTLQDIVDVQPADTFQSRMCQLAQSFKFGKWDFELEHEFLATEVRQSDGWRTVVVNMEKYIHQIQPISLDKTRRSQAGDACVPKEVTRYRSATGSLQYPVSQCFVSGAATVSISQAMVANLRVQDLIDMNKSIRFFKSNADVGLRFSHLGSIL